MTSTETPEVAVSPKQEMAAEVERRVALLPTAPASTPAAKENVATVAVPKTASDATGTDGAGAAATPTTPATPPAANAGQDVSWVPEELRSLYETADEKARGKVRELYFKADDYTKKTTAVSDERKALKDEKERLRIAAETGEAVLRDPELMQALSQIELSRMAKAKPEPFDYLSATPEDIEAHEAAIAEKAAEKALATIRAEQAAHRGQSETLSEMATAAHVEFVASGEYDKDAVNAAYQRLADAGVKFSKDNVVSTLRMVLPKKAATPQASPPVTQPTGTPTNGASALTRGAGVTPALKLPAFMREKREPASVEERLQAAQYVVNQRLAERGQPPRY